MGKGIWAFHNKEVNDKTAFSTIEVIKTFN